MNNEPNKKNGAKPAVAHKKNILDDRRIRLALSVLGAIVAWMGFFQSFSPRRKQRRRPNFF